MQLIDQELVETITASLLIIETAALLLDPYGWKWMLQRALSGSIYACESPFKQNVLLYEELALCA
ncbi:MAG: hypothetical protein V7677_14220 [Motiliproteus sp.]